MWYSSEVLEEFIEGKDETKNPSCKGRNHTCQWISTCKWPFRVTNHYIFIHIISEFRSQEWWTVLLLYYIIIHRYYYCYFLLKESHVFWQSPLLKYPYLFLYDSNIILLNTHIDTDKQLQKMNYSRILLCMSTWN